MIILFDITPIQDTFSQSLFRLIESEVSLSESLITAAELGLIPTTAFPLDRLINEVLHTYTFSIDDDHLVYCTAFRRAVYAFRELFQRTGLLETLITTLNDKPTLDVINDLLVVRIDQQRTLGGYR